MDEALAGLVAISPGLTLLESHRVVIRNDPGQEKVELAGVRIWLASL